MSDDIVDRLRIVETLLDVSRYGEALDAANDAIVFDANDSRAHALRTLALTGLNKRADAEISARKVVSLAPESSASYALLCRTLTNSLSGHDPATRLQAVTAGREAVRLDPLNVNAWLALASAAADPSYIDEADRAIRQAIGLRPSSPAVWVTASFVALKVKSWLAAEQAARKALLLDPGSYAAANNLGEAMRHRGRYHMSVVALHGAAAIDPGSPEARGNLESVGYQYMATLMMIPALLVPAFIGNILIGWLAKQPEHFRPLARRLGFRLATSPRYQRLFEAQADRRRTELESLEASNWSVAGGRRGTNWLHVGVVAVRSAVLILLLIGWATHPVATWIAIAVCLGVFFVVVAAVWIAASIVGRRDGY